MKIHAKHNIKDVFIYIVPHSYFNVKSIYTPVNSL
jgi:hypothetical protein